MPKFIDQLIAEARAHTGVTLCRSEDERRVEQKAREAADQLEYDLWSWDDAMGLRCHTDPQKTPTGEEAALLRKLPVLLTEVIYWQRGAAVLVTHDIASVINHDEQQGPHTARMLHTIGQMQRALNEEANDETGNNRRMEQALKEAREAIAAMEQAHNAGDGKAISDAARRMQLLAGTAAAQYAVPREDRVVQLLVCDSEEMQRACGADAIEMELPTRAEAQIILEQFCQQREIEVEEPERVLDAVAGLLEYQIHKALLLSWVSCDDLDPHEIAQYKKRALQARGIVWMDPDPRGFAAIGGLNPLKDWCSNRALTFDQKRAAQYDVDPARGVIVAGTPGCGKSLTARCVSAVWELPLLYADLGATRGKFHGESEKGLADLLRTADAAAGTDGGGCVLWIDEGEKALAGGAASAELDSGVGARTLQMFLTWLQEHKSRVFVYMTANRPDWLPPELMRAGRFDAQFWVDYPSASERRAICRIYRDRYRRAADVDLDVLTERSEKRTGAEIEAAFKEAAIAAMSKQQDRIMTADIVRQLDLLPKTADTFTLTPELERWKKTAMKANDPEIQTLDFSGTSPVPPGQPGRVPVN